MCTSKYFSNPITSLLKGRKTQTNNNFRHWNNSTARFIVCKAIHKSTTRMLEHGSRRLLRAGSRLSFLAVILLTLSWMHTAHSTKVCFKAFSLSVHIYIHSFRSAILLSLNYYLHVRFIRTHTSFHVCILSYTCMY